MSKPMQPTTAGVRAGRWSRRMGALLASMACPQSSSSLPLVTSVVDLLPIIQTLVESDTVSAIGDRRVRPEDGVKEHSGMLANVAAKEGYAVLAPPGETVEIEVTGDNNLPMVLWGYFGG